jgi:hypothetical protein
LEELLLTSKYEEELDKFWSEIVDFTRNKLNSWMLWEIQEKNEKFYIKKIVLNIRSYTLVLQCKQYLKEKIILVYDLEIMK